MPREERTMALRGGYPLDTRAFTAPGSGREIFQIPYFKAIHIHFNQVRILYQKIPGSTIANPGFSRKKFWKTIAAQCLFGFSGKK
jgi:hypothetical protein